MATDATGATTSNGIPTFQTNIDAPSGKGFNAAMAAIDTLVTSALKTVFKKAGAAIGTRRGLNFIDGTDVSITVADNAGSDQADVTVALPGTLAANARLAIAKAGTTTGTRRKLNLIEGNAITITEADDAAGEKVDVTIASTVKSYSTNLPFDSFNTNNVGYSILAGGGATPTVAAGLLGASSKIRVRIAGRITNSTGSNQTMQFQIAYGAITGLPSMQYIFDSTSLAIPTSATSRPFVLEFVLSHMGSTTNSNVSCVGKLFIGNATAATLGLGALSAAPLISTTFGNVLSGFDLTSGAAHPFDVTATASASSASLGMSMDQKLIEVMP